jgi:hypothetical protein
VLGACWPCPSFEENLVIFDCFWDFDSLSKMEHNTKQKSWKLDPFLGPLWVFGDNVMGKGCQPMGLPTLRPTFVMYK